MSSVDLDQVLYARARWRKTILIPLWVFQLTVLLGLMGIFAYRLAETFEHYEEMNKLNQVPIVEVVWEATNVGFNLITLILTIVEIARKATERLTPFMMVSTQIMKLTLAFAVLALDIVAYLQRMDGYYSTIGLSLDCGLLAANLLALIYSIKTYRRVLHYEDYHLTANTRGQVYAPGEESLEMGYGSYRGTTPNKPFDSSSRGMVTEHTTELHFSDSSYPSQTTQQQPLNPSHSNSDLKRQVDRAISAEFGWGDNNNPPPGENLLPGASSSSNVGQQSAHGSRESDINRSGSVVLGGGKVAVHHGGVVAPDLHRQQSWVTERGVVTDGVGGDGDLGGGHGRRGSGSREEDEEALLPGR
ncbi:hypothetical protein B0J18DRAFT_287604 [Chaetomium sp. MPI-SDFR-AT-0129]|nr:hypothetical protein B0J18DRAFT_287604 [Chaetomium sp. MPI-SDFR-AT-0129]